jgi:threonine dehydrogenase-like Zn-dependent dehydrogenase
VKALVFERKEARYAAAIVASKVLPGAGAKVGPLTLAEIDEPEPPGPGWLTLHPRLAGICGSDLSTLAGKTSRYFEPLVSFPFVLGHEIVGNLDDGTRVVIDAVLGHQARGEPAPHDGAAPGDGHDYGHLIVGPLEPGIQIGNCESTGGGWSTQLIVHESQIHEVPADLSDEAAVMVEPTASGVHAALRADVSPGDTAVVLGSGTIGLCTIAALRHGSDVGTIIATAKYPLQRQLAKELGADIVVTPSELRRAVRRETGGRMTGTVLARGADVTIDAVGSAASIEDSIAVTRPRGRVVLCGMPGNAKIDLSPLWHRETELVGAYTYGTEVLADGTTTHTFDLAFELVRTAELGRLVSALYPLDDYEVAIEHAAEAGPRGASKIAFDLRV